MFDQGMGDGYNGNQYSWGHSTYGQYGQWSYDGYNATPWYNQCPYNNWNWYTGYNNYEQAYPPCHHFYAANQPSMPLLNDPNSEYRLHQRHLTGHYLQQEASSMADPPLWKSLKIDCFSAKMDVHGAQSELLKKGGRFFLNKSGRRKNRKRRFSGTAARSTTTMKNSHSKLGRKVYLNGGGLAYILFKPKETECCDEQNRGDSPDVPFTYYPSKKRHDMEKEFFENIDRQLHESEQDESPTAKSNEYINNLNKLYADINGGLGSKTKSSVSHCTPEELAEIRHEFEVFFNKTTRTNKQTQTKLKMKTKTVKPIKPKGRMKWTLGVGAGRIAGATGAARAAGPETTKKVKRASQKATTQTKKLTTLRKDTGAKSKKPKLPTVAQEPSAKESSKEEEPSGSNRWSGVNSDKYRMSVPTLWQKSDAAPSTSQKAANGINLTDRSTRSPLNYSRKALDEGPKNVINFSDRNTRSGWNYGRKPIDEGPKNVVNLTDRSRRSPLYYSRKVVDEGPKTTVRSTYAKFPYSTSWREKK
uniref:Uncharacterized protein n=1 Tax=Bactrocera dorsalis TaxID=27457 RepID=A0A034V1F8_BACDO